MSEIYFPRAEEWPIWIGEHKVECGGHKAIVGIDEAGVHQVHAISSNKYNLIQHEDAFEIVQDALFKNPEFGSFVSQADFSPDGSKMRATIRFPEVDFKIRTGDTVNPTIEIFNSYDLSWKFQLLFGAFRLVCSNGLIIGENFLHTKKRHMPSLDIEAVSSQLSEAMEIFSKQTELWKSWADEVLAPKQVEKVIKSLDLNKGEYESLEETEEVLEGFSLQDWFIFHIHHVGSEIAMTRLIFFNILTQFLTHNVDSVVRRTMLEQRLRNSIYNI